MTLVADARTLLTSASPSRALKYLPLSALALDLVVMVAVGVLAAIGRARLPIFGGSADVTGWLDVAGPLMLVGWLLTVAAYGGYRVNVFGAGTDEYKRVAHASLVASGLVGVGCYLAKFPLSRGFFLLAFALGLPALLAGRYLLRRALHRARLGGALLQRVLIAGSPAHVDEIAGVLRRERWLGYDVVGALTPAGDLDAETPSGIPVLGSAAEAPSLVGACGADVIFFAGGALGSANQLRQIVWDLEQHDVQRRRGPERDRRVQRAGADPPGGRPAADARRPADLGQRLALGQAALRHRRVVGAADRVRSAAGRLRPADRAARPWAGRLPPDAGGARRRAVPLPQVPDHGGRCRGPAGGAQGPASVRRPDCSS